MNRPLVPIGLALIAAGIARADFDPVPLTASSYTVDAIVEKTAPPAIMSYTTASMDDGTNNSSQTWFEIGYDPSRPAFGLPAAGSVFSAIGDPNHSFKMPSSYSAANALLLTTSGHPTGTITLAPAKTAMTLSLLAAVSGGATTISYSINYQGGTPEAGTVEIPDWFNTSPANVAYIAKGRVNVGNAQVSQISDNPRLFYVDIALGNTAAPVTSIALTTTSGNRVVVFGVSTSSDGSTFSPADVTGFNRDMVVESTALVSGSLLTKCNVIMDSGATNLTGNTWYEMGFNRGATNTGLPKAGTSITNTNLTPSRTFTMPSSYTENNVVYIGNYERYTSGTLTLTTQKALAGLSFLSAAGNGPVGISVTVWHADGSSEPFSFESPDWFNQADPFFTAGGRFHPGNLGLNNVNENNPRLYARDIALGNTTSPVTSIDFAWSTGGGRAMIFAVAGQTASGGVFTPLAVTGFTADGVVEASADRFPNPLYTATTASMDGGTNNTANTWYEAGYYPNRPETGLAAAGSVITSLTLPDHRYQMAGNYAANNAIFVDSTFTNSSLTLANPQTYSALSFLSSCANGRVTNYVIMQYADGTTETNYYTSQDWFGATPYAFTARGRMNLDNRTLNNLGSDNPRLYEAQFALGNTSSPITNIVLGYQGSQNANGRMFVFAVSGTAGAVPPIVNSITPQNSLVMEGMNLTISATLSGGTEPIGFTWQKQDGANWVNLQNGGVISGATTKDITFTALTLANAGTYRLMATNAAGPGFSGLATVSVLSGLPDVTKPGDPITMLNGSASGGEGAASAIGNTVQRYRNLDDDGNNPYVGPAGFIVVPSMGSTIVSGLRFYTSNDSDGRDPADYTLEGSNDGGLTWSLISTNTLGLPTGRNTQAGTTAIDPLTMNLREVLFANSAAYVSYRLTFYNVRDNGGNNSVQFSEVEFLGVAAAVPPVITRHPTPTVTVVAGANPRFSVEASGAMPLSYQWYRGANIIPGATNDTYVLVNAQVSDSGATFKCRVTNANGFRESNASTLTVLAAPTQPYPSVVLADDPMGYWRINEPDNGAGNTGVVAKDYAGGHNGQYNSVALQAAGYNAAKDPDTAGQFGTIAVSDSYIGNIQGIDFGAPQGSAPVNFSVEAWVNGNANFQAYDAGIVTKGYGGAEQFNLDTGSGGESLRGLRFYVRDAAGNTHGAGATNSMNQDAVWHHVVGVCDMANGKVTLYVDGQPVGYGTIATDAGILGTTLPVSIGSRQPGAGDPYSNQFYGYIDDVAIYDYALTPEQVLNHFYGAQFPPIVMMPPQNLTANEGGKAEIPVVAYGAPTVTYQWYDVTAGDPGTLIPGQTSNTLVIPNLTMAHNGRMYRAVITNPYGTVTSPDPLQPAAMLTIASGPPQLTADLPAKMYVYAGRTAKLAVKVSGTEPITYVWQSNGVQVVNGGRISGAQTATLTIANAQPGDSANYQVFVSNTQGGPVASAVTALTVSALPTFNTDATGWTLNGSSGMTNGVLTLTTTGSQAGSIFLNDRQYIREFRASFTYQDIGGGGADGFAFVMQNDPRGTNALGGAGGGLGYSGIAPSAAMLFNIYGTPGVSMKVNGTTGDYQTTDPVNIASGNPINVVIETREGMLRMTLTDTVSNSTATVVGPVGDLATIVGSETAYVGFTGASGGVSSHQQVKNFTFVPLPRLASEVTGVNSLLLAWPASIGGFLPYQSSDLGSGTWQPATGTVNVVGDEYQMTVSPLTGTRFFRLQLP